MCCWKSVRLFITSGCVREDLTALYSNDCCWRLHVFESVLAVAIAVRMWKLSFLEKNAHSALEFFICWLHAKIRTRFCWWKPLCGFQMFWFSCVFQMRGPTLNTPIPPGHQMALWPLGDRVFQVQSTMSDLSLQWWCKICWLVWHSMVLEKCYVYKQNCVLLVYDFRKYAPDLANVC